MSDSAVAKPSAETGRIDQARIASVLRWVGALGIVLIAVMRCCVFFADQVVFDVDPAFDPQPIGGLGPAGSLWLDVLLLIACACGLIGEALARRGIDWLILLLALIPLPVVLAHGHTDADDLWRGVTWAAAALAGATIAHLARDRSMRPLVIALLLAVLVPILLRGAANVTYEHQANIARFEAQKQTILRDKGWTEGSPNALIFERRLRQRQPSAWFVTTNVFGTMTAFGVIAFLGGAIAATRARFTSGWPGLLGLLALAAVIGLWMTGSAGALLAMIGGLVLVLAPLIVRPLREIVRRFGPVIVIACIVGALGGVVVRGAVLPEGFLGEKSLLFRWHYMQSSAAIIAEQPGLGTGPADYQAAYMLHRVPRNPEEVASAHSVFIEWVSTLGVSGVAWIALTGILLWRAGGALGRLDDGRAGERIREIGWRPMIGACLAVGVGALVPAIIVEWHVLDPLGMGVRFIGVIGYVVLAGVLLFILRRAEPGLIDWTLTAAVLVVAIHGQIEMSWTRPNAVVWLMVVLGVAGGAGARGANAIGPVAALIAIIVAGWIGLTGAIPATKQTSIARDAAGIVAPIGRARGALFTIINVRDAVIRQQAVERLNTALGELDIDVRATSNINRATFDQIEQQLRAAVRDRRPNAADRLLTAAEAWPRADWPLLAAAEQLERTQWQLRGEARLETMRRELAILDELIERGDRGRATNLAYFVHHKLAQLTGDGAHREWAIEMARRLAEADPHGIGGWRRLGDLLWEYDRPGDAADAYERALQADRNLVLDPLKRLPADVRRTIEIRIDEARKGG